jgi:GWxTD domain-containing protein
VLRLCLLLTLAAVGAQAQPLAEAEAALARGDYVRAADLAREAVALHPDGADAAFALYQALVATGQRGEAGRALSRAIALDPANVPYREVQIVHLRERRLTYVQNEYLQRRRAALARDLLALDPSNPTAHEELALHAVRDFDDLYLHAPANGAPDGIRPSLSALRRQEAAYLRAVDGLTRALEADSSRVESYAALLRLHARTGDWPEAFRVARQMARHRPDNPNAWLWLGLAEQRLGNDRLADLAFARGLARSGAEQRAAYRTTDLIAGEGEPQGEAFWDAADPLLLTPYNERLLAHYARVAFADLVYAAPRVGLRGWQTRRGQTFIRYGAPRSERILSPSGSTLTQFAVWEYDHARFVFEDLHRSGEFRMASARAADAAFGRDPALVAADVVREQPQRYAFEPPGRRADVHVRAARFRLPAGGTDLVVAYGLDLESAAPADEPHAVAGVFAGVGGGRVERRDTLGGRPALAVASPRGTMLVRSAQLPVGTDPQRLSVEVIGLDERLTAVARTALGAADFDPNALGLSDLLLAFGIEEVWGDAPPHPAYATRGDLHVLPAPTDAFRRSDPLYLYFEGYNLTPGGDGIARCLIEIDMVRLDAPGRARGVSVRFPAEVEGRDLSTYQILDLSDQAPGRYRLTLRLRDEQTGDERTRQSEIRLW